MWFLFLLLFPVSACIPDIHGCVCDDETYGPRCETQREIEAIAAQYPRLAKDVYCDDGIPLSVCNASLVEEYDLYTREDHIHSWLKSQRITWPDGYTLDWDLDEPFVKEWLNLQKTIWQVDGIGRRCNEGYVTHRDRSQVSYATHRCEPGLYGSWCETPAQIEAMAASMPYFAKDRYCEYPEIHIKVCNASWLATLWNLTRRLRQAPRQRAMRRAQPACTKKMTSVPSTDHIMSRTEDVTSVDW